MTTIKGNESKPEQFVSEILLNLYGVQLRKLPESKSDGKKTPDFELLDGGTRCAVMEVKTLDYTPRTLENGWTVEIDDIIKKAERIDNSPKRVATLINKAWKQLSDFAEPKILTFVNDEPVADNLDLEEALNGFMTYENEEGFSYNNFSSISLANGRIKDLKWNIDLYIWIDRVRRKDPVFRFVSEEGYRIARLYFACPDHL
jgi:hypothetical protein